MHSNHGPQFARSHVRHFSTVLAAALAMAASAHAQESFHLPDGCSHCKCPPLTPDLSDIPFRSGYDPREAPGDTDLLTVDLQIDLTGGTTLSGSNTMNVRSLVNGLTQFSFVLDTPFLVQRNLSGQSGDNNKVTLNGSTPAAVSLPPTGSARRTVTLDRPYAMNETFTVKIDYRGTPISRGFGSIHVGAGGGYSLSEPYYAATWWPVKDGDFGQPGDNADKATGSISIAVPDNLKAIANGLLTSITVPAPGKKQYRWTTNYPTSPYLFFFAAANYTQWQVDYTYPTPDGASATMPVQFSVYQGVDSPANRTALQRSLLMMAAFRDIFGEYPFVDEKYGIYQFDFGGGQEHQTYTGQSDFDEYLTAHELSHHWWGDNVTCKYWNDIWLNEGFASYAEALWAERRPGSTGLPALRSYMNNFFAGSGSVYVTNLSSISPIFDQSLVYAKGAWVLHQLRHVVGDATFFQILRDYRNLYQGRAATTLDFANVASATSGQDLSWFFTQWVMGAGMPVYSYAWQPVTIAGAPFLRLYIAQTQNAALPGGGAPAGYFRMPIDLRITESTGSEALTITNNARAQYFLLPLAGSAIGFQLDPDRWVLSGARTIVAYPPGPAQIALAFPSPGEHVPFAPTFLELIFSEAVNIAPEALTLTGPDGVVPFLFASTATGATLYPSHRLQAGAYTLGWNAANISSVNGGALLDGEFAGALPSGNGLAGGDGSFTFIVDSPCNLDFNEDGNVDANDVDFFINNIAGESSFPIDPDLNQDGNLDQDDVDYLINAIAGGGCP